ncbi:urease accessory protein UreF [Rhodobacteraceae bacterium W635]|uniref:urease accessory protein UreF n=1 Tax=Nioella halotolerans TaxID=2303578 RepID=UPI000E3B91C5|nr:urease accessory protein UreF [Rhodobacteraceae bacterium W635]
MATVTDTCLLTLAQWFSPAYPVGGFAYSHGLEAAIDRGRVRDADTLADWIETVLSHGAGHNDALFLAAAYRAGDDAALREIDRTSRAFAASAERLKESDLQGQAFCQITGAVWQAALSGLTYPVAAGRAARLEGLPLRLTAQMFLHAFTSSLATVGMRLIPLGQTEGQAIIHRFAPLHADLVAETEDGDLGKLSSTAFGADIDAMIHETQYSRIFRT